MLVLNNGRKEVVLNLLDQALREVQKLPYNNRDVNDPATHAASAILECQRLIKGQ